MIIECLESVTEDYFYRRHLTPGKKYEVLGENILRYLIINDHGKELWCDKELFKVVEVEK